MMDGFEIQRQGIAFVIRLCLSDQIMASQPECFKIPTGKMVCLCTFFDELTGDCNWHSPLLKVQGHNQVGNVQVKLTMGVT
jgi:hypothetical protein